MQHRVKTDGEGGRYCATVWCYGAVCDARYCTSVWSYARPMRCPVLRCRMVGLGGRGFVLRACAHAVLPFPSTYA
eukprot:1946324-Rhodomonas_salina.1